MKAPVESKFAEPLPAGQRELPFVPRLYRDGPDRLGLQLFRQLREGIEAGVLPAGTLLPASRTLARTLGIARGVVVEAYTELALQGYLETRHGRAGRVRPDLQHRQVPAPSAAPAWVPLYETPAQDLPALPGVIDFTPGRPTLSALDARAWRQSWARVARQVLPADYRDPAGEPEVRAALSGFLAASRGLRVAPERLLVTGGAVQALALIAGALLRPLTRAEDRLVAVENPGYPLAREVFREAGATVLPVPVDQDGLIVEALPPARLVYVTPSHQYPLGVRMSAARRLALLQWADRHDALIVEDDYDSEYRYGADPLPTLASLDERRGRVLYLGTLSKTLSPALRLGYLAAPSAVLPALLRQKLLIDGGTPWPLQMVVGDYLRSGQLERHIRRTRRHYAQLSAILSGYLSGLSPLARLGGLDAGLHACLHLAGTLDASEVADACWHRGVRVVTLAPYTLGAAEPGLLLGFGGLTRDELLVGCEVLVSVIQAAAKVDR